MGLLPAKPGNASGSAVPTTSSRKDLYAPQLIEKGLRGMIGKGLRSTEIIEAMKNRAIYLGAVRGAVALLAKSIKNVELIVYKDLGPEAIRKMTVENFS